MRRLRNWKEAVVKGFRRGNRHFTIASAPGPVGDLALKPTAEEYPIKADLPGDSDFNSFEREVILDIPAQTEDPEQVPGLVYTGMTTLLKTAREGVDNALESLQAKIAEYRAKLGVAQANFVKATVAAKDQLIAEAKAELATLRIAKTAKTTEVVALRRVKSELPKQIEDAEYSNTGDPRIRVGYVLQEMKNKMAAATALITATIGGIDLVLASAVFVMAADETTGWVVGGAYAILLGFFMHQSAHYGRQVDANEEAKEAESYHREAHPDEKRKVRSLSEIVAKRARWNYNALWATGVSMAAIRLLVAVVTGEWKGSTVALVITIVAFGVALAGVELLKKFMAPYGDQHQIIGDMKKRFANMDAKIAEAENKEIVAPQGLASAKTKYGEMIKVAKSAIPSEGKALIQNGKAILTGEAEWLERAKDRFVQACMSVLELVVTEQPDEPIEETDLLSHFEARGTNHPLAEELRREAVMFGAIDTTTPTADTIVAEVDKTTPVIEPPKPEPVIVTIPKKSVKLVLKKGKQ